jgi:regulator of sigma E protease
MHANIVQTLALWILPLLAVLTLVVTVHELGHYLVARWCGVAMDRFSIGFGRAIAKWRDKRCTEWRIGWIPLGGYVRFSGDESVASVPDAEDLAALKREVLAREGATALNRYYHFKPVWQRALVAVPVANFVLAIAILTGLALAFGVNTELPRIHGIEANSPAARAGLQPGDVIRSLNGRRIDDVPDVLEYVILRPGEPIRVGVERAGHPVVVTATPVKASIKQPDSDAYMTGGHLGVEFTGAGGGWSRLRVGPLGALVYGVNTTGHIIGGTFDYIGRIFAGKANGDQFSGFVGMGGMAKGAVSSAIKEAPSAGAAAGAVGITLLSLSALISVAVGIANLLPIPVLDGGHLLFYLYEAVARRPLAARVQEVGYRVGLALVAALFVFTTFNDLQRFRVIDFIGGLFS